MNCCLSWVRPMCSQWVFRRSEAEVDLTYSFQRYKHTSLKTGLIDRMKERKWVRWNRSHGAVGGEVWSNLPMVNAFVFGGSGVTASRSSMASFGTLLRIVYLCLQWHVWATRTDVHTRNLQIEDLPITGRIATSRELCGKTITYFTLYTRRYLWSILPRFRWVWYRHTCGEMECV